MLAAMRLERAAARVGLPESVAGAVLSRKTLTALAQVPASRNQAYRDLLRVAFGRESFTTMMHRRRG